MRELMITVHQYSLLNLNLYKVRISKYEGHGHSQELVDYS